MLFNIEYSCLNERGHSADIMSHSDVAIYTLATDIIIIGYHMHAILSFRAKQGLYLGQSSLCGFFVSYENIVLALTQWIKINRWFQGCQSK